MTPTRPGVPPPGRRLRHVDGLTGVRALAALWVLAHHLNAIVGPRVLRVPVAGIEVDITPLLTCGWVGVDIFFVLSGFLLTRQLLDAYESGPAGEANRRFLLHRVLRVYPAYLAQILAVPSGPSVSPKGKNGGLPAPETTSTVSSGLTASTRPFAARYVSGCPASFLAAA